MAVVRTRVCTLALLLAACAVNTATGQPQPAGESEKQAAGLLVPIRQALEQKRWTLALERIAQARAEVGDLAVLNFYAALAHFQLGQLLGTAQVRQVPGGVVGQFDGDWLLVEQRGPQDFLCASRESALFQLRRALAAGLSDVAAHVLHARIWLRLGRANTALELLRSSETALLESNDSEALTVLTEAALAADQPAEYLRYSRIMARRQPERRAEILGQACARLAAYYASRGEPALHREFCRRALRHLPADAGLTLQLADAEWQAGSTEEARRLYRRTLELAPQHPARKRIVERLAADPGGAADLP